MREQQPSRKPETRPVLTHADQQPEDNDQIDQIKHVAERLAGSTAVTSTGELDLMSSVGGIRGIAEAVVPALVFLVSFILTSDIWVSAIWAVGLAAVASLIRLVQRQPLTQALAGFIGVAVSAIVALTQDDARGYYVIGFYVSAAYGLAFAISMIVKWPVMGLIYGWIRGEGVTWQKALVRRRKYQIATLLMVLVFGSRLIVQLPMYWADDVVALGTARLVMGVPLYALVLWFGWLLSKPKAVASKPKDTTADGQTTPGKTDPDPTV